MLSVFKGGYYFDEIAGIYKTMYKVIDIPLPEAKHKYEPDQDDRITDEELNAEYEKMDEDLVEMVNAGLLPFIVMDEHKARFWQKIFPKITIHETPVFREGGVIAWAVRKESPKLLAMLNQQIKAIRGKATGEEILARYLKRTSSSRALPPPPNARSSCR